MKKNSKFLQHGGTLPGQDDIETMFKVMPPLRSGPDIYGYYGVLLRQKSKDTIQCHKCGRWYKGLGSHVYVTHGQTARQYRKKYGLPLTFPLCSRSTSSLHSKRAKKNIGRVRKQAAKARRARNPLQFAGKGKKRSEAWVNVHGICDKQILKRYNVVSEITGRSCPSKADLLRCDKNLYWAIFRKYKTLNNFRKKHGLLTRKASRPNFWTDEMIIACIRSKASELGRSPMAKDFRKVSGTGLPNETSIHRVFGSFRRALLASGVGGRK